MNREIKFRAWDGNRIRYDVTGFEHGIKNEMAGVFLDGDYYSMEAGSLTARLDERHAVVMQWTGLKDKNGVEIYEGDILSTDFAGKRISEVMKYEVTEKGAEWTKFLPLDRYEVIGNIFKNPELLERQSA